jgi:hypothetical protein
MCRHFMRSIAFASTRLHIGTSYPQSLICIGTMEDLQRCTLILKYRVLTTASIRIMPSGRGIPTKKNIYDFMNSMHVGYVGPMALSWPRFCRAYGFVELTADWTTQSHSRQQSLYDSRVRVSARGIFRTTACATHYMSSWIPQAGQCPPYTCVSAPTWCTFPSYNHLVIPNHSIISPPRRWATTQSQSMVCILSMETCAWSLLTAT